MSSHLHAVAFLMLTHASILQAQQQTDDLPETKVVLRISRQFIHELSAKQFTRDLPVEMNTTQAAITGSAHAEGTTNVQIHASENSSDFELIVHGQVTTQLVATCRAVQVHMRGSAPFEGRRQIVFDDDAFTGQRVQVHTNYHSTIDRICSFRGGLYGAVARGVASTTLRRTLSDNDLQASDEVHARLTAAIEQESNGLLATLNKVGAIVKQGEELLRQEKMLSATSVQHYLAATEHNLYISIGPPKHRIAKLPRLDPSEREPIELWVAIKKPGKVDRFSPVLANWKLVKPFLLPRIAQHSPESAKILDQVQVKTIDGWHIVTFAPKLLDSL